MNLGQSVVVSFAAVVARNDCAANCLANVVERLCNLAGARARTRVCRTAVGGGKGMVKHERVHAVEI